MGQTSVKRIAHAAAKESERDHLICDENGFAQTKDLPYGVYTVHQTSGWDGRDLLSDFDVFIAKDGHTYRYLANNAFFKSYVKVVKVDAETGKTIPYAGAGFKLYRPDDTAVSQNFTYPTPTTIDTFYTNVDGTLVTPEALEYGDLTAADGTVIPADGLLEIVSVDENGHAACLTDLPFGSFYVKELSTDGHYLVNDKKYPVTFEYAGQDTALVELKFNDGAAIENDLIYGEIHGLKKDEDGNGLAGAVMGLFRADTVEFTADTALMTTTSQEDGSFSFDHIPYGEWAVCEIKAPTGFVRSETVYPVTVTEDGAVIEVEVENTAIRGTVQLTKVDKDYPDNKLAGAEFDVYRDNDGDKALGENDELMGTLTEVSVGVYEMGGLKYGGFFVKERTAPEGFCLDENAYYFEIVEDGETVIVENEAGVGFIDTAQVGSLKIVKTSSDGKVEGFTFHVTGPNGYDEMFTTDSTGEILIEGLRLGEYVVSEVSDAAWHIHPLRPRR